MFINARIKATFISLVPMVTRTHPGAPIISAVRTMIPASSNFAVKMSASCAGRIKIKFASVFQ